VTPPGERGGHEAGGDEVLVVGPVVVATEGARAALVVVVLVAAGALALRAPELLAVAVPLVIGLTVDLLAPRPAAVRVAVGLPAGRVVEGDPVGLRLTVDSADGRALPPCGVVVRPTRHLVVGDGDGQEHRVVAGEPLVLTLDAVRWGAAGVAEVDVVWRAPFGLLRAGAVARPRSRPVRVHPPTARLRALLQPRVTGAWSGVRPAAVAGRGVEFAELRPFAAGDLPRDVNWRVSARRGEPWVAARHPERSIDVVLLLDAFEPAALDTVVRRAAGLLKAYLADRDRVGVLGLSGVLRWVAPGGGDRHRHRVLDELLRTQSVATWATRDLGTVPARALPPGALVIACTRLGPAMAHVVTDLVARRRDVVVLDLEPPLPADPRAVSGVTEADLALAVRLAALQRDDARDRLRRRGATVVAVPDGAPLATALAEAAAVRRSRVVAP
jgi:uncharacterized protein (DUF58 family)